MGPSELAGLTPEMISAAIGLGMQKDKMMSNRKLANQGSMNDLMKSILSGKKLNLDAQKALTDKTYKEALTRQALANAKKAEAGDTSNKVFVKDVPAYGDLTLSQYKALSTDDKEYVTYYLAETSSGNEPKSQAEYKADTNTPATPMATAIKDYIDETGNYPDATQLATWVKMFSEAGRADEKPYEPTRITWNNAMNSVRTSFGKMDATGNIVITGKLQAAYTYANKKLDELRLKDVDPQTAVNQAIEYGRNFQKFIDKKYRDEIDKANNLYSGDQLEKELNDIKSEFYEQYSYTPAGGR